MSKKELNSRDKIISRFIIRFSIFISILLLILNIGCQIKIPSQRDKGADIAIYSDEGVWDESVTASTKMFQWMGYTVKLLNADYINREELKNFNILCVPGGDMYQYAQDISPEGKDNIKNFVSNGGGYIGICGGAYFASEKVVWQESELPMTPLRLFSGTAKGPIDGIVTYPDYGMCEVNIMNSTHPVTISEPDSMWVLYYWGPLFLLDKDANLVILGSYNKGNQPVMLASDYGKGRVFLIGTHPEIEENSDRDGVNFGNELDDKGSDWDLMKKATLWCLKEN